MCKTEELSKHLLARRELATAFEWDEVVSRVAVSAHEKREREREQDRQADGQTGRQTDR